MPKSKIADMLRSGDNGMITMPPDNQIGVFEKFTHSDGWIRDRVVIQQQDGPGGKEPVDVNLNGFRIRIPRNVECDIARPFVDVLRHAVETRFERGDNGEEVQREVPRYNWQIIKEGVNLQELKTKLRIEIDAENREIRAGMSGDDT